MKSILGRLKLWQKFALFLPLAAILVAPPLYQYLKASANDIATARLEALGAAPTSGLVEAMRLLQQHRGLSAFWLNGDDGVKGEREAKQAEVDKAFEQLAGNLAATIDDTRLVAGWSDLARRWKETAGAVAARGIPAADSFARHTRLIQDYLNYTESVADYFGLTLDPEAATYYLIVMGAIYLPNEIESMAQVRGLGVSLLKQTDASADARDAIRLAESVSRIYHQRAGAAVSKASADDSVKAALATQGEAALAKADAAYAMVDGKLLQNGAKLDPKEFYGTTTAAIDAQFALDAAAFKQLGTMLAARVDRLTGTRLLVLSTMSVGFVIAVLLGLAITRAVTGSINATVRAVDALAVGDLTHRIEVTGSDETSKMLAALKSTMHRLQGVIAGIKSNSANVAVAANEIASGNNDLSQRTESQASSLQETASSMEQLTATVRQNADNARQANQLAVSASEVAGRGGHVVDQVVGTMSSIEESSKKIVDIITVIDGIAFQTNILALNAAVEAARAGEQGRGFAVVATEVRNLAQRSAGAAKEIKALINDSVGKVSAGTSLVAEAGRTMREVVDSVKRVTDIMAEISAASQEQSSGIEQVNLAVTQMDQVTQQNAALVEEAAAAAESLKDQSRELLAATAVFRIDRELDHHSEVPAPSLTVVRRDPQPAQRQGDVAQFRREPAPASVQQRNPEIAPRPKPGPVQEVPQRSARVANSDVAPSDDDWEEF